MFYVGEWLSQLIICHLVFLKYNFGEVEVTMFESNERPCELIIRILIIQKSEKDEVDEVMIQVGEWPSEILIRLRDVLKVTLVKSTKQYFKVSNGHVTNFLHPGHRKKRLGRSCGSDVYNRRMGLKTHLICLV
jgi:hypothetical protein